MPSSDDPTAVVVLTTMPDHESAATLATRLVDERWIACANLLPGVTSIYRWDGAVTRDSEVLVVMKTTADRAQALEDRIVAEHPYDVPEVLALPVVRGHRPYLDWIADEVDG